MKVISAILLSADDHVVVAVPRGEIQFRGPVLGDQTVTINLPVNPYAIGRICDELLEAVNALRDDALARLAHQGGHDHLDAHLFVAGCPQCETEAKAGEEADVSRDAIGGATVR